MRAAGWLGSEGGFKGDSEAARQLGTVQENLHVSGAAAASIERREERSRREEADEQRRIDQRIDQRILEDERAACPGPRLKRPAQLGLRNEDWTYDWNEDFELRPSVRFQALRRRLCLCHLLTLLRLLRSPSQSSAYGASLALPHGMAGASDGRKISSSSLSLPSLLFFSSSLTLLLHLLLLFNIFFNILFKSSYKSLCSLSQAHRKSGVTSCKIPPAAPSPPANFCG